MNQIVPPSLLFDYRFQIPVCPNPSRRKGGRLLKLPQSARLPALSGIDGQTGFATINAGWNSDGLAVSVAVNGRTQPLSGSARHVDKSDRVELWIDTRPTGNVHRATGYCHRLACLPCDELADGSPAAVPLSIAQQREVRAEMQARHIQLRLHTVNDSYELEVWIPASQLYGFDEVQDLKQLGFYCLVCDTELGEQPLTVADTFPFAWDPSLWVNLELMDA